MGHMDPMMVVGPMAMATTTVGITVTATTSYIRRSDIQVVKERPNAL